MSFDPLKNRLDAQRLPLLNLCEDILDQIFILDSFTGRCLPAVLSPVDVPDRHAVDGVPAVGDDANVAVFGYDFEGAEDGREFGSLICLPGAGEGFGEVSVWLVSALVNVWTSFEKPTVYLLVQSRRQFRQTPL